jgi:hypothetical protein
MLLDLRPLYDGTPAAPPGGGGGALTMHWHHHYGLALTLLALRLFGIHP